MSRLKTGPDLPMSTWKCIWKDKMTKLIRHIEIRSLIWIPSLVGRSSQERFSGSTLDLQICSILWSAAIERRSVHPKKAVSHQSRIAAPCALRPLVDSNHFRWRSHITSSLESTSRCFCAHSYLRICVSHKFVPSQGGVTVWGACSLRLVLLFVSLGKVFVSWLKCGHWCSVTLANQTLEVSPCKTPEGLQVKRDLTHQASSGVRTVRSRSWVEAESWTDTVFMLCFCAKFWLTSLLLQTCKWMDFCLFFLISWHRCIYLPALSHTLTKLGSTNIHACSCGRLTFPALLSAKWQVLGLKNNGPKLANVLTSEQGKNTQKG